MTSWSQPRTFGRSRVQARRRTVVVIASALVTAGGVTLASLDGGATASAEPAGAADPVAPVGVGDVDTLQPAVARSIRKAVDAAAAVGVDLSVTSGRRSAERQAELYADAVREHGSPQAARRWVLPPEESAHVTGAAVDVGPPAGAAWLAEHGVRFGLCQRYDNEPWHFERLAGAEGSACPAREPHP